MGQHKRLKCKIVERGTNDAPRTDPILVDEDGNEVTKDHPLYFNKRSDLKKVDHFRLIFEIEDFGDSPLRFAPDKDDVLWVKQGDHKDTNNCPKSACHDLANEIWVDYQHPQGKRIEVINMDLVEQDFWFTLNLVQKDNPTGPFVPVDPPGGNQNGGTAGSGSWFSSSVSAMVAGAVVGPLAATLATNAFVSTAPIGLLLYGLGGAILGLIIGSVISRF